MSETTVSRRAFMRSASVAALATVPAGVSFAASEASDAELLTFKPALDAAEAQLAEAHQALDDAEVLFFRRSPLRPAIRPNPDGWTDQYRRMTIEETTNRDHPLNVSLREVADYNAAQQAEWNRKRTRLRSRCGLAAAERRQGAAVSETNELARRALAMRARTLPGIALKLQLRERELFFDDTAMLESIAADVQAMVAGCGHA